MREGAGHRFSEQIGECGEKGMMGSVVVLLHSTGQTQVISSSQERTRHSRATEDPHGERSREVSRHYNGLSSMGLKRKYYTIST